MQEAGGNTLIGWLIAANKVEEMQPVDEANATIDITQRSEVQIIGHQM